MVSIHYTPHGIGKMNLPETIPETLLTPDVFAKLFPIPRSLRREHLDLFGQVLSDPDSYRDDGVFYSELLTAALIDPRILRDYDVRLLRTKKQKLFDKAFGRRAVAWLMAQPGAPEGNSDLFSASGFRFPAGTLAGEVQSLLLAVKEAPYSDYESELDADEIEDNEDGDDFGDDADEGGAEGSSGETEARFRPEKGGASKRRGPADCAVDAGHAWSLAASELLRRIKAIDRPDVAYVPELRSSFERFVLALENAAERAKTALSDATRFLFLERLAPGSWGSAPEDVRADVAALALRIGDAGAETLAALEKRVDGLITARPALDQATVQVATIRQKYQETVQRAVDDPGLLAEAQSIACHLAEARARSAAELASVRVVLAACLKEVDNACGPADGAATGGTEEAAGANAVGEAARSEISGEAGESRPGRAGEVEEASPPRVGYEEDAPAADSGPADAPAEALSEDPAAQGNAAEGPAGIGGATASPETADGSAAPLAERSAPATARESGLPHSGAPEPSNATEFEEAAIPGLQDAFTPFGSREIEEPSHAVAEDDGPARWGGDLPVGVLVMEYLAGGDAALAWHLGELAQEHGLGVPVPPSILKALAAAPAVFRPYDATTQRVSEMLAAAAADLEALETRGDSAGSGLDAARALFFASLLRPGLIAPNSNARTYLGSLSMRGPLVAFAPLQKAIAELGFDVQPSADELVDLAGQDRSRRLPAALREVERWLGHARAARSFHAPTHMLLHELLAPSGEIGAVFEAVLAGAPGAEEAAERLIGQLIDDRSAQEEVIHKAEQRSNRPRRDRIRDSALEWACRKLQDGATILSDWLGAARSDRDGLDDRRRQTLQRQLGGLTRALSICREEHHAGWPGEEEVEDRDGEPERGKGRRNIAAVAIAVTGRAVSDLEALIDGTAAPTQRLSELLEDALLRLPGGTQMRSDEQIDREDAGRRRRRLEALTKPAWVAPDERAALEARRAEAAILPARRLLERLTSASLLSPSEVRAEMQAIDETAALAARRARSRVEGLRLELAAIESLDHGAGNEVVRWLDRLSDLAQALAPGRREGMPGIPAADLEAAYGLPPDFPELEAELKEAEAFRDDLDGRVRADQRQRLARLAEDKPEQAEHVATLLATLEERDRVTVEDLIAQLRDGQPMPEDDQPAEDVFRNFYPDFVQAVQDAERLSMGRIVQALEAGEALGPLDFAGIQADFRRSARLLLEQWRAAENALRGTKPTLREHLPRLLEALGFFSVRIARENLLTPGRLARFQVHTDPLSSDRWFLPPAYGSEANGSYPVLLAASDVTDDQLSDKLADQARDAPCILFVFGRLNRQRRETFARTMRRDKQTVLLVDETQILFLAMSASDRLERLMACAMPFGYLQPYTTNARNIPAEMFFGRRAEIEKIESRNSDGCLVYGGRQLGKSALLNHIRKRMHAPERGVVVVYRDIEMIGRSDRPTSHVWRVIGEALADFGVCRPIHLSDREVLPSIRSWLSARDDRRILMLLDETDNFLASEGRQHYPNLKLLKDVMEETGRRFKVVFAGLHNVRRSRNVPNSPLVHLGEPICVGPLNTSAENSAEARRMVTAPMQAAGYDYESPLLAWDILARVNHYPSLVQVFCKTLLEGLASRPVRAGEGPRWKLDASQIFEGTSAQEINRLIRERFQWTLDLDPRYELIAKVLARHRLEHKEGGSNLGSAGFTAQEVAHEVLPWWPRGIQTLSPEDFAAFLDEMVDLGVLARFGPRQDQYGLRSALVAQMMGQREEIEDQILRISAKEPRADYAVSEFHRRISLNDPLVRSPLADRALGDLFDPDAPGVRILAAAPGVWGDRLAERLRALGQNWDHPKGRLDAVIARRGESGPFQAQKGRSRRIAILDAGSWDARAIEALANLKTVRSGEVVPVCLAGPSWLAKHRLEGMAAGRARLFLTRPWSEAMLRSWLEEAGLERLDTRPLRAVLMRGSGGAPAILARERATLLALADAAEPELTGWEGSLRLSAADAGLPPELARLPGDLDQLITEDEAGDFDTLADLVETGDAPFRNALALLADLGLITPGDVGVVGVALTPLGRLVARSEAGAWAPDRGKRAAAG